MSKGAPYVYRDPPEDPRCPSAGCRSGSGLPCKRLSNGLRAHLRTSRSEEQWKVPGGWGHDDEISIEIIEPVEGKVMHGVRQGATCYQVRGTWVFRRVGEAIAALLSCDWNGIDEPRALWSEFRRPGKRSELRGPGADLPADPLPPEMLTADDVGKMLGVDVREVRRLVAAGKIPGASRRGPHDRGRIVFDGPTVRAWRLREGNRLCPTA
jgi:hypothetical protein